MFFKSTLSKKPKPHWRTLMLQLSSILLRVLHSFFNYSPIVFSDRVDHHFRVVRFQLWSTGRWRSNEWVVDSVKKKNAESLHWSSIFYLAWNIVFLASSFWNSESDENECWSASTFFGRWLFWFRRRKQRESCFY